MCKNLSQQNTNIEEFIPIKYIIALCILDCSGLLGLGEKTAVQYIGITHVHTKRTNTEDSNIGVLVCVTLHLPTSSARWNDFAYIDMHVYIKH